MKKYFLSSMENKQLEYVRECTYFREVKFNTGKNAVIVKLDKSLQWSDSYGYHGSDYAIITARHEGYDVIEPKFFPTFVYVTVLKEKDYDFIDEIESDDLITIGIGELYATYEDAKNNKFDC